MLAPRAGISTFPCPFLWVPNNTLESREKKQKKYFAPAGAVFSQYLVSSVLFHVMYVFRWFSSSTVQYVSGRRHFLIYIMEELPKRLKRNRPNAPQFSSIVVIGGGIAGVCCAQEFARNIQDVGDCTINLISSTGVLKEVIDYYGHNDFF
jgi:hypothetical protein